LLAWAAACGAPFTNSDLELEGEDLDLAQAVPWADDLRLAVPEEGEVGTIESGLGVLVQPLTRRCSGPGHPDRFCDTVRLAKAVNGEVVARLRIVETLVRKARPSVRRPGFRRFGPYPVPDLAGTEVRLDVARAEDGVVTWEIAYAPAGTLPDAAAWRAVVTGGLEKGREARHGRGTVSLLLDEAAAALGADVGGQVHLAFELDGCTRGQSIVFDGYRGNDGDAPLSDGLFHYEGACDGSGRLDWAFLANVHSARANKPCRETVHLACRWDAAGAGRVDGLVSGGEVVGTVDALTQCWDEGFAATWDRDLWQQQGDEASCVFPDAAAAAGAEVPAEECAP